MLAALKNPEQQNLGVRQLGAELLDNRDDTLGDFFGSVNPTIVLTDHDDGQLRLDTFNVPMLEPPQHVFGPVAADPQIQGVAARVVLLPDFFALIVEVLDDGIADVDQIHVSLPGPLIHDFMPQEPIGIGPPDRHDGRVYPA